MTLIDQIRDLVANGQTEKSIEELLSYVKENNNEVMDQLVLLKSRMKTLNNAIIEGTIEDDVAHMERAKINESILKILNDITPSYLNLEKKPIPSVFKSTLKRENPFNWVLIVGAIALITGIVMFYNSQQPVRERIEVDAPTIEVDDALQKSTIQIQGKIIGSKGINGQLVVRFIDDKGLTIPGPINDPAYRDLGGILTAGTPSFYINSNSYSLNKYKIIIPHNYLNSSNSDGKTRYLFRYSVEIWIDNQKKSVTLFQPFTIKR